MCCSNKKAWPFWWRYLTATAVVTIVYIIAGAIFGIQWRYGVNDDSILMTYISGMNTGTPEAYLTWERVLYGAVVAKFYELTPGIPWYIIFHLFFEWLSLVTIFNVILKKTRSGIHWFFGVAIFAVLYFRILLVESLRPQFTTLAGLCVGAVIVVLLSLSDDDEKSERIVSYVTMFLLSYVGLNLREELIYIAAVLFIGTFILMFIRKNATLKQIVVFSAICFVMISASLVADKVYVKTHNWQDGWNFINARSSFIDYDNYTYEEYPEGFDAIGWDDTLDVMSRDWFFMDENVTTEALEKVVEFSQSNLDRSITAAIKRALRFFLDDKMVLAMVLVWGACSLVALVISWKNKKAFLYALGMAGFYAAGMGLWAVLFYINRYPQRVIDMVLLLTLLPSVIEAIEFAKLYQATDEKAILKKELFLSIACTFALVLLAGSVMPDEKEMSQFLYDRTDEVVEYVKSNPDKIFVKDTDIAQIYNPFTTQPVGATKNLICWGECFYNTPVYFRQINANGYEQMTAENFFDDNVYVIRYAIPSEDSAFMKYMRKRWSQLQVDIVDAQEYFTVIKFTK